MSVSRQQIIDEAQRLVDTLKARGKTHGQGDANFVIMAELLYTAGYNRRGEMLDALDACIIYEISKLARIICGDRLEPDHYLDTAGYAIIAAAIARSVKENQDGD